MRSPVERTICGNNGKTPQTNALLLYCGSEQKLIYDEHTKKSTSRPPRSKWSGHGGSSCPKIPMYFILEVRIAMGRDSHTEKVWLTSSHHEFQPYTCPPASSPIQHRFCPTIKATPLIRSNKCNSPIRSNFVGVLHPCQFPIEVFDMPTTEFRIML